jgi:Immunity protein 30
LNITYEIQLRTLREDIRHRRAKPSLIDSAINSILSFQDDRMPHDLLVLLSDNAEYDDGMFSLIHAAESVDNRTYVNALLSAFSTLAASSPRWASIILMRALNNDPTRHELVGQLRTASPTIKGPIREICLQINQVSPQFLAKTAPVLIAAAPTKLSPVN